MKYLSHFKIDLLNTIQYFVKRSGEYILHKKNLFEAYSDSLTPQDIEKEIGELIVDNFLTKRFKKKLTDKGYRTLTYLSINHDTIKEYNDRMKILMMMNEYRKEKIRN